jgi:hypothetical protein
MRKQDLVALLQSVSTDELKKAIPIKERMEALEKRKTGLEKELASVVKQIESLVAPLGAQPASPAGKRKAARKGKRRRVAQPSLASLIAEILREKKKPLRINDICDALLEEKKYRTRARDFKAQIRVMMYRNEKGLFKKVGPGLFKLTADTKPQTEAKSKAKAKPKGKKKTTTTTKAKPKPKTKKKAKAGKKTTKKK